VLAITIKNSLSEFVESVISKNAPELQALAEIMKKRSQVYPSLPTGLQDCRSSGVDIVVATCNEDLQWLAGFKGMRIFVYEKCDQSVVPPVDCIYTEKLPNLAMESLAYATHLKLHYADFGRYTVFVQGSPLEHSPSSLFEQTIQSLLLGTFHAPTQSTWIPL